MPGRLFALIWIVVLAGVTLAIFGCSDKPCPYPQSRDWKGQCSQRGGM